MKIKRILNVVDENYLRSVISNELFLSLSKVNPS